MIQETEDDVTIMTASRFVLLSVLMLLFIAVPASAQQIEKLAHSGNALYALFDNGDVQVSRVNATSGNLYFTTRLALDAAAEDMVVDGNRLFVALGDAGIEVFDLTDPTAPAALATLADSAAEFIALNGDTLYVGKDKLTTAFSIADLESPVALGQRLGEYYVKDVTVTPGGRALISSLSGVEVMHAPASDTMTVLTTFSEMQVDYLVLDGSTGYAIRNAFDEVVLGVVDFSDPSSPALLGDHTRQQGEAFYLNNHKYTAIAVNGTTLYVSYDYYGAYDTDEYGFEVWDVSTPASPSPVTKVVLDASVTGLDLVGGHLVAVSENNYYVYDLTDPEDPTQVSFTDLPELEQVALPASPMLVHSYPNPFNPTTTITLELAQASHVQVAVFDLLGRQVAEVQRGYFEAGSHRMQFNGNALASGVYFLRASSLQGAVASTRLVLVR